MEFRGYPMKGCRAFAANALDYRQDAVRCSSAPAFTATTACGVPEAAERARTIRVAELDPAGFGCCQRGRGAFGDHLALVLGDGGEDMNG